MKKTTLFSTSFLVLSLALVGAGCSTRPQTANQTLTDAQISEAAERFGSANVELVSLLQEASQKGIDVSLYVSRQSQAALKSSTNMVAAADDMEQIVTDVRAKLGK